MKNEWKFIIKNDDKIRKMIKMKGYRKKRKIIEKDLILKNNILR